MIETQCPSCGTIREHEVLEEEETPEVEREVLCRCCTPGCGAHFTELLLVGI